MKPTPDPDKHALAVSCRVLCFLGQVELAMAIASLAVICCLTGTAIVLRYFFDASLLWGEEISLLLMKVLVFFAAAAIYKGRAFLCVGFLYNALPNTLQNIVSSLTWVAAAVFAGVVFWQGAALYPTQINVRSYLLELPKFTFTLPLLYGSASIFLTSLYYAVYTAVDAYHEAMDPGSQRAEDHTLLPGLGERQ